MNFETVEQAFNYWNVKTIKEIEERSQAIKQEVETNPDIDVHLLNIEVEGLSQAKDNLILKRSAILNFNPIIKQIEKEDEIMTINDVAGTTEYRNAFLKHLLGKELSVEERNAMETVTAERRADQFNTVTNNAHVIPTQMLNEIVRKARTQGGLLNEARAFNVPANLKVPVGTPLTKAKWHAEGAMVNSEKTDESFVEFLSNELIKIISVSAKFKRMSLPSFESYLTDELVASVMESIENALIHGTGSNQGKGLETISWVKDTNAIEYKKGSLPTYTDFTKVVSLLKRGYSKGAKFAMNNATLFGKVYSIVDGNNRPIFIQDTQVDSIGKILGFEVVIDDNIGDGVVYFGNYHYLGYNLPEGVVLEVSRESSFNKGLIDYRALAIADTQVIVPEAFVKLSEAQS